jgi:hypothetical protein
LPDLTPEVADIDGFRVDKVLVTRQPEIKHLEERVATREAASDLPMRPSPHSCGIVPIDS